MSDPEVPLEERVAYLERELTTSQKQITNLSQELLGTITILCLPLSQSKRLEIGFKLLRELPPKILEVIVKRYVQESKSADLNFDGMISPIVNMLGFERAWKILSRETIKDSYGDWALGRWDEMAKSHECED
jgi:hypothetical protein